MTSPDDELTVEINYDFDRSERQLDRSLDRIEREVQRSATKMADSIEDAVEHATDQATRAVEQFRRNAAGRLIDAQGRFVKAGATLGESVAAGAEKAEDAVEDFGDQAGRTFAGLSAEIALAEAELKRLARQFDRTGDATIKVQIKEAQSTLRDLNNIRKAMGDVDEQGRALGGTFDFLAQGFQRVVGGGLAKLGLLAGAAVAAGPAVIALGGALADLIGLLGLLPGSIGVAAAAIAPLILAFQGIGDAVEALASGDLDKINEAMKRLAPSARTFAREIHDLAAPLGDLQRQVQQAFFAPLEGQLTRLVNAVLPELRAGLVPIAAAFGDLGRQLAELLGEADIQNVISDIFASTLRIIQQLGPTAIDLIGTLAGVAEHSLPFIERMAAAFNDALVAFDQFLSKSLQTGDFEGFLEDAFATVRSLVALASQLGRLFVAIFASSDDAGRGLIDTLADLTGKFAAFFESAEGQRFLEDFVALMPVLTSGLLAAGIVFETLAVQVLAVVEAFRHADEAAHAVADFFTGLGRSIASGFDTAVDAVDDFLTATGRRVRDGARAAVDAVVGFFQALPGRLVDLAGRAFDAALQEIGIKIGLLVFAVTELPGLIINALAALPGLLADFFHNLWTGAVDQAQQGTQTIIDLLLSLGPRALAALAALPGIVFGALTALWNGAIDLTRRGLDQLIAFVVAAPGRIAAAAGAFLNAGTNLIRSLLNGLSNVGDFAGKLADRIIGAVKGGINRAIDGVNAGIAKVDAILPGDLPRIPHLAKGGLLLDDTLVQAHAGEAVVPLTDGRALDALADAIGRAGGGGPQIMFANGSIQINFSGAVPTDQQARTVGEQAADGISSRLAIRGIRTGVRTVGAVA